MNEYLVKYTSGDKDCEYRTIARDCQEAADKARKNCIAPTVYAVYLLTEVTNWK